MAAARIATVLSCSSDHVSAIATGSPLAANRHTIDAALLTQLMTPASIGNDALAYLIKTYQRAHQNGMRVPRACIFPALLCLAASSPNLTGNARSFRCTIFGLRSWGYAAAASSKQAWHPVV